MCSRLVNNITVILIYKLTIMTTRYHDISFAYNYISFVIKSKVSKTTETTTLLIFILLADSVKHHSFQGNYEIVLL